MKESFRAIECKLPGGRCLIFIGTEGAAGRYQSGMAIGIQV